MTTPLETVTADWLTEVLRRAGDLPDGEVTRLTVLADSETGLSRFCRLHVEYAAPASATPPAHLLVKLGRSGQGPEARGFAGLTIGELREREVTFYRDVAPLMPDIPLVRCFAAGYQEGAVYLVLEDLSATHATLDGDPPPEPQATAALHTLARLHAAWWDDPRLGREVGSLPDPAQLRATLDRPQRAIDRFLEYLGPRLPPARRALYARLRDFLPEHARRLAAQPQTLIHRDAHWRNFLLPTAATAATVGGPPGPAVLFDWQSWGPGAAASDLAYALAWHWSPEPQLALAQRLIRHYHARLTAHGVRGYSHEECLHAFRLAAARTPCGPATMWANGVRAADPPERWVARVEHACVLFDAFHCADLMTSSASGSASRG